MHIQVKDKIGKNKKYSAHDIVNLLLKSRNIDDIETFLAPPSPLMYSLSDFGFTKKQINHAMNVLKRVYDERRTIVVYTDYDADGITGGSILWETLHLLGFQVMPYVPDRKTEGYGFSVRGIDRVKKEFDPGLIISVDHGITGVTQVSYAKSLGIPVIVTDHHHKQEKIPDDAVAIFHIPALSGSGTAYYVAKEIFEYFKTQNENLKRLETMFKTDYLALATIGTVADLVPLLGQSRSLVSAGLAAFPRVKRHGIRQIIKQSEIEDKDISPYEIGFVIAPRINAVGRLEHGLDALRLLCTTDEARATELAHKVGDLNTSRQDLVKKQVVEAVAQVEKMDTIPPIIILSSDNWHEGVIGLIASQILEKYYRPTIIMTRGDGFYKASARSIPGFHMTDFLTELSSYLTNFGGHAAAAGFTLPVANLDTFIDSAVKKAGEQLHDSDLERSYTADLEIPLSFLTKELVRRIQTLAPFGIGNPTPTFLSNVEVLHAKVMGRDKNHLKLAVREPGSSMFPFDMVAFGQAELFPTLTKNQNLSVVYQLGINVWNGKESLQGMVKVIADVGEKNIKE
ncbi:single-stranded-DNA-specific exonuclease RecJ [Candidatus Woesebacteria bacterium]|nr:single-stranded-DNA-specific exonuclease RecJ [Candidatus Woesebacteria bacterium]